MTVIERYLVYYYRLWDPSSQGQAQTLDVIVDSVHCHCWRGVDQSHRLKMAKRSGQHENWNQKYHKTINQTDLDGGEHEHGSRSKQQQAPKMLQLWGQAEGGNTVQQGRQQRKDQASNTPLQPVLYAPVIQIPTPCVWQAPVSRAFFHT